MKLSFDTEDEAVADVARVVGAAYGVTLTVQEALGSRKAGSVRRRGARGRGAGRGDSVSPAEVRRWAAENGLEVSSRGALPKKVAEAYTEANAR